MSVNCDNAVRRTVSLLPAHARSRPRVPGAGRCLVHVGCTARLRRTASLGTGLSRPGDLDYQDQIPQTSTRECPPFAASARSIGHAAGTQTVPRSSYTLASPQFEQRQAEPDGRPTDPLLAKYPHVVGYRRWPEAQPLPCLAQSAVVRPRCGQE